MKKEIICTICPRGCYIWVEGDGDTVRFVEGHSCKRGLEYASTEYAHPVRILTTTIRLRGKAHDLLPVRSAKPVPREKLMDCMAAIREMEVALPVASHDIITPDLCGTGVALIATKSLRE